MIADEPIAKPNPVGRPPISIDRDVVRNSARIGCTADEIAAVLGISRSVLYKYMALDDTIQAAIDEGRDHARATLRRFQWQRAEAGSDTMCIWLGKQLLGQKDKTEMTGADNTPFRVVVELVGDPVPERAATNAAGAAISRLSDPTRVQLLG